jgi:23S rRNA pseudouridine1911/1915/1917 synthase
MTPKIIYEDENYLVINKPVGLLVHKAPGSAEPTLVDWLIKHDPKIKTVGDNPDLRPGLVHRLDKETSGVMVIAKTAAAFEDLKKQFAAREVKKEYRAWVYGKIAKDQGEINFSIERSKDQPRMAAKPTGQSGKAALTEYLVLERKPHLTLVRVRPQTGATHQIRVHFFALGHPVVGDPLYQIKRYKKQAVTRMLLHARSLGFRDLEGEWREFTIEPPAEFGI